MPETRTSCGRASTTLGRKSWHRYGSTSATTLGGHASLFRQVADDAAPNALPLRTALSALASARAVFDATWLWQRDMYEHYQLGGGSPTKAAL